MTKRDRQKGFVLIAAIWFVALLALVSGIIAGWMTRSLGEAAQLQDRLVAQTKVISATNEVAWMMVSNYFSQRGLEELSGDAFARIAANPMNPIPLGSTDFVALGDQFYRFSDGVVQLQDAQGLYNFGNASSDTLSDLLKFYGIPYQQRLVLADRLLDYMGNSGLHHLNGADADDYLQAGRPPPRGEQLLTPWESFRVLGWDDVPALWSGPFPLPEAGTISIGAALNPNTAPPPVLGVIAGIDASGVNQLLQYRATHLLTSPADLQKAANVVLQDLFQVTFYPADQLRIKLAFPHDQLTHLISIRVLPRSKAPYRIDYQVDLPLRADARAALRTPDLPLFPAHVPAIAPPPSEPEGARTAALP